MREKSIAERGRTTDSKRSSKLMIVGKRGFMVKFAFTEAQG